MRQAAVEPGYLKGATDEDDKTLDEFLEEVLGPEHDALLEDTYDCRVENYHADGTGDHGLPIGGRGQVVADKHDLYQPFNGPASAGTGPAFPDHFVMKGTLDEKFAAHPRLRRWRAERGNARGKDARQENTGRNRNVHWPEGRSSPRYNSLFLWISLFNRNVKCYILGRSGRTRVSSRSWMSAVSNSIGARIDQAMDLNPRAPSVKYGRLTWLQRELANLGVEVTVETVRKWASNEVTPRAKKMTALAQVLGVDEAWLALGRSRDQTAKTARTDARGASGAVLAVAAALELEGLRVGFSGEDEGADLSAVIEGCMVRLSVVLGREFEGDAIFELPGKMPEHKVIGVARVDGALGGAILTELREEDFTVKQGRMVATIPVKRLGYRKVKSVAQLGARS